MAPSSGSSSSSSSSIYRSYYPRARASATANSRSRSANSSSSSLSRSRSSSSSSSTTGNNASVSAAAPHAGGGGGGNHNHSHYHAAAAAPPPPTNFFAPPFYNRPPTPLPPSPSLTSLLRPSRPTTPDSSGDEPLAPPVARASPRVPTYEYYGFALYLFASLAFLIYLLWSYLPSPFLHALGIDYYPNRWWSLAMPSFLVVAIVYIYVALAAYNTGHLTLRLGSLETVVDDAANVAVVDAAGRPVRGGSKWLAGAAAAAADRGKRRAAGGGDHHHHHHHNNHHGHREDGPRMRRSERERAREGRRAKEGWDWRGIWNEGTDAVMDVPLGGVCEVLYGEGRDAASDDGLDIQ